MEPREDLDQLQLVVEIRVEPEHVRPVAMALERPVTLQELALRADVAGVLAFQERGADATQLVVGDVRDGTLVQHVAPRHDRARQARAA
jgi:hypothetical protein